MWEKSKPIPYKLKTVLFCISILLTLATVTPALADYLGPNRTVTESSGSCQVVLQRCSYVPTKKIYKYKAGSTWSCSLESQPWLSYPSSGPACNENHVGATYWKKVNSSQTETITYPPATIQGLLQNCSPNNGWCTTFPQFSLIADEPLPAYDILAIEGTWNGQNFACPDPECSVPLIEGENDLTYWALSSWGDSSTMGSLTVKVDSELPVISGAFDGTPGSNGWYVGPVSFTGSAADTTSGLASFTCTLDGAALGSCNSITVDDEGPHTLVLTALDIAGNVSTVVQDTSIDSRPPALSSSLQGSLGSNSWYNNAELHASATDPIPGSELFAFEYSIDGTAWVYFPSAGVLGLPDGKHSVDVHVIDQAGHSVSSSTSYWLDSVAPTVIVDPQGTSGANGWYVTNLNLSASVSDDTSGVDIFEYIHNGSTWTTYTSPLVLVDGSHTVSFWGQDKAGLVTQVDRLYQVDTVRPQIAGTLSGTPGTNGWYTSNVILSASAADPSPGSGVDAFTYILDNGSETPYTSALTIPDGVHTVRLNVQDKAGLLYFTEQSIKVDTVHPTLSIQTTLPSWVNGSVTLSGLSEDNGSGISKVEISTNGGQTWRIATGTTSWAYEWDTTSDSNGSHNVIVRATDQAGLTSQQTFTAAVDNQGPNIHLRSKWLSWQAALLDIWDDESGIAEARIEILDPENRWPRRLIKLTSEEFPMNFKWDRRFGDDSIAPNGDYVVLVTAIDRLGNVSQQYAAVSVVIDMLPAGPTSTPQPYYRVNPTPIVAVTPVPELVSVPESTPVVSVFGEILPTSEVTPIPETSPIPRAAPTQTGIVEWLESVLLPRADVANQTIELQTLTAQPASSSVPGTTSNILWGAAAAAMVGAVTSYALEEKRKREDAIAAKRAEEAALEERKSKIKVRKMKKLEEKWAEERNWEIARLTEQAKDARLKAKLTEQEIEDQIAWATLQNALQKQAEAQRHFDKLTSVEEQHVRLDTYVERPQEAAEVPESNWWEKTKSFVKDNVLDPWNQYVYEPIVKPLTEKRNEVLKDTVSWLDTNVYQPFMAERVDSALNNLKNNAIWLNETVIQPWVIPFGKEFVGVLSDIGNWVNAKVIEPYVVPFVTKSVEYAIKDFAQLNEKVIQPYLVPAIQKLNETVYQPYLSPIVNVAGDWITAYTDSVTEHIYEPIFAPIVNDINKYIVKPYVDPAVAWWDKTWEEYGEWVHNGLDAVGFVPGLGDIMDGVNGLIYFAEGRYLEASISAVAMIPVLGDLAKAGKLGLKVTTEIVEEAAEKVVKKVGETIAEKATKELAENVAQKATTEVAEELAENVGQKVATNAGEELAEKATKEALENSIQKTTQNAVENASSKALAESVTNTAENVTQKSANDIAAQVSKNASQTAVSASTEQVSKEVKEEIVQQALKQADDKTTKIIRSLERTLGDDVVSLQKGISLLQKHGDAAIKALNGVNQEAAQKLLKNLDEDVLDFAIKEGTGAFDALSRWPESDLLEHGVELALRAKKDAMVLEATRKLLALGPFDPVHITSKQRKLINQIAENSLIYADEGQVVIGKHFGLDAGYLGLAKQTGSLHYSPHPDLWNTLEKLGAKNQDTVAWLINQQALQTGIGKGLPFEFTNSGLSKPFLKKESEAIAELFSGCSEERLREVLRLTDEAPVPFRIRELQELQKAGYQFTLDNLNSTYLLVKP